VNIRDHLPHLVCSKLHKSICENS